MRQLLVDILEHKIRKTPSFWEIAVASTFQELLKASLRNVEIEEST